MSAVRNFEEFVKLNIVKKQSIDRSRAGFLIKESEKDFSALQVIVRKVGVNDATANTFARACYDILMELIRAKMLLEGYNASGFGAHEAEVAFLRILKFNENDVQFADQLRYFRNGMLYYGTMLDAEYTEKVLAFTNRIYPKLKQMATFTNL